MKFERVSFAQFHKDLYQHVYKGYENRELAERLYYQLRKPQRNDYGSAGYDFFAPFSFALCPGDCIFIPTGFKVKLDPGFFLLGAPRSGQGSKYFIRLANTVAIIDERHHNNPENEGTIYFKLRNEFWGEEHKPNSCLTVNKGQSYAQGILTPYAITEDDSPANKTHFGGGFGSTDLKEKPCQESYNCKENNSGIVL